MKKADNFNIKQWLTENKITTQSRLNENSGLAAKIAVLPNHHTAEDTDKATLIVGKYAVVHYDESDEGGEDMYVVWDNTVDQDEIGSYDDVPEFESEDPAEVAAWLEQNASRLNELPSNFSFTQDDVIEMALEKGLISKENVEQPEVLKALRTAFSRFTPEDNPTLEDAYRMFKYHL